MINDDFEAGFMVGYWGGECPEDASSEFIRGHERGYATCERESALAGEMV